MKVKSRHDRAPFDNDGVVKPVSLFGRQAVQEGTHAHWFCEQKALDQIESKFARGDKIGVSLYTDRNSARAELTSDISGAGSRTRSVSNGEGLSKLQLVPRISWSKR